MSRIIEDCLVAGGLVDEPERGTAEVEECQRWWLPHDRNDPDARRRDVRRERAIRCKWSGFMPRRAAECGAVKVRAEVSGA